MVRVFMCLMGSFILLSVVRFVSYAIMIGICMNISIICVWLMCCIVRRIDFSFSSGWISCCYKSWMGSIRFIGALIIAYCSRCDSWLYRWNSRKGKMIYFRSLVARFCLCNYCFCCVKVVCRRIWKIAYYVLICFWFGWRIILSMRWIGMSWRINFFFYCVRYIGSLSSKRDWRFSDIWIVCDWWKFDICYVIARLALLISFIVVDLAIVIIFRRFFVESLIGYRVIFVRDGMVFCNNANFFNVFVRYIANN